jgi:hypothetical protein
MAAFSQAPLPEIIERHVLPQLPVPTLLALCATSSQYRQWCQDESLWAEIARRDYPGTQRLPGQSWLQLIREMQQYRLVPISTWGSPPNLVIHEGMTLADFAYLLFYLPYVYRNLDRQRPITLAAVRQAAKQLGALPTFRFPLLPSYNDSRLVYPTGQTAAGMVLVSATWGAYRFLVNVAPGPAGTIRVGEGLTYPPTTVLSRTFLQRPTESSPMFTLYSAIVKLAISYVVENNF